MKERFLNEAFYHALDGHRQAKRITWKAVGDQAEVSPSTLTRIAQGKRPDVDTLAALCRWSGLKADEFIDYGDVISKPEPLGQIMALLRADKNIEKQGAAAIEVMIKSAYEQFRKER